MCGSTVRDNNTYWENPGGIDGYNVTSFCPLNVEKNIASVCQIRLDFIPMILSDPDQNPGTATRCLVDFLTVSGASNIVPNICGHNMNQHSEYIASKTFRFQQLFVKFKNISLSHFISPFLTGNKNKFDLTD